MQLELSCSGRVAWHFPCLLAYGWITKQKNVGEDMHRSLDRSGSDMSNDSNFLGNFLAVLGEAFITHVGAFKAETYWPSFRLNVGEEKTFFFDKPHLGNMLRVRMELELKQCRNCMVLMWSTDSQCL